MKTFSYIISLFGICGQLLASQLELPSGERIDIPEIANFNQFDLQPGQNVVNYVTTNPDREMHKRGEIYVNAVKCLLNQYPEFRGSDINIYNGNGYFSLQATNKQPELGIYLDQKLWGKNILCYVYCRIFCEQGSKTSIGVTSSLLPGVPPCTVDDILQSSNIINQIKRMEPSIKKQTPENYKKNESIMRDRIQQAQQDDSIIEHIDSIIRSHKTSSKQSVPELMELVKDNLNKKLYPDRAYPAEKNKKHWEERIVQECDASMLCFKFHTINIPFGIEFLCMTAGATVNQRKAVLLHALPELLTNHFTIMANIKQDIRAAIREIFNRAITSVLPNLQNDQ